MSDEIVICRECQTENPLGSKFCNNCGTRLPPSTRIMCPHCQTPNPRNRFYCDNCGKRLIEDTLPTEEEKPDEPPTASLKKFSLPERKPGHTGNLDPGALPDWLSTGELSEKELPESGELPKLQDLTPLEKSEGDLPDWLVNDLHASAPAFEPPEEITTDHFLELLQGSEDEPISGLDDPFAGEDDLMQSAADADLPDWLSDAMGAEPPPDDMPPPEEGGEWHTVLGQGPAPPSKPEPPSPHPPRKVEDTLSGEDLPDWMQELGPAQTSDLAASEEKEEEPESAIFRSEDFAEEVEKALSGQEDVPDWMQELGPAQTTDLPTESAEAQTQDEDLFDLIREDDTAVSPEPAPDLPDWLAELEPEQTGELAQEDESLPDFLEPAQPGDAEVKPEEAPDWFSDIAAMEEPEPIPPPPQPSAAPATPPPEAAPAEKERDDFDALFAESAAEPGLDDWLSELEEDAPGAAEPASATEPEADIEAGLTDWLSELDSDVDQPVAAEAPAAEAPPDSITDWLSDLDEEEAVVEETAVSPEPAAPAAEADNLDWLKDFPEEDVAAEEPPTPEPPQPEEAPIFAETQIPDWLNELGPPQTTALQESEPEPPEELFQADEMDQTGEEIDSLPNWLDELGPAHTAALTETGAGGEGKGDFEDLFTLEEDDEMLPDWLLEEDQAPTEEPPSEVDEAEEELQFEEAAEEDIPPLAPDMEEPGTSPDWLSALEGIGIDNLDQLEEQPAAPPQEAQEAEEPVTPLPASETPQETGDLMESASKLDLESEQDLAEPRFEDFSFEREESDDLDLPDWISELSQPTEEESAAEIESAPSEEPELLEPSADLPDWLTDMRPDEKGGEGVRPGTRPPAPADVLDDAFYEDIAEDMVSSDLPDWLHDSTIPSEGGTAVSTPDYAPIQNDVPEWLVLDAEDQEGELLAEGAAPITDELSALLDELPPSRDPAEELARADIPDWVQALKPKPEEVESEHPLQESGPLTGIRGVVEVAPAVVGAAGSTRVLTHYTVTEAHQQQANLLQQLARLETAPTTAGADRKTALSPAVRILLTLLLLAGVIVGLLGVNLIRTNPVSVPTAVDNVNTFVTAAAGQPVLLAFEYGPAAAAELTPQAQLLIEQLEANGSPIITLSQYAPGVQIAQTVAPDAYHLGFVPGEAAGLRQVTYCLRGPGDCLSFAPRIAEPDLQQALSEVGLLIVLTGDRDSLVNWVEQVGGTVAQPLLMGTTQALRPLSTPYLNTEQLAGTLSGLPDTAVYQQTYLPESTAVANLNDQRNAQHIGQWIALVLFIIGGVTYGISGARSGRKSKKDE